MPMHIIAHYRRSVSQYACVRFPAVIVRAFSPKSSLFSGCTFSPFVGCVRVYLVAAFESTPLLHSMCVLAVFECVFLAALVGSANEPWCCTYDCGFEHVEFNMVAAHERCCPSERASNNGASSKPDSKPTHLPLCITPFDMPESDCVFSLISGCVSV